MNKYTEDILQRQIVLPYILPTIKDGHTYVGTHEVCPTIVVDDNVWSLQVAIAEDSWPCTMFKELQRFLVTEDDDITDEPTTCVLIKELAIPYFGSIVASGNVPMLGVYLNLDILPPHLRDRYDAIFRFHLAPLTTGVQPVFAHVLDEMVEAIYNYSFIRGEKNGYITMPRPEHILFANMCVSLQGVEHTTPFPIPFILQDFYLDENVEVNEEDEAVSMLWRYQVHPYFADDFTIDVNATTYKQETADDASSITVLVDDKETGEYKAVKMWQLVLSHEELSSIADMNSFEDTGFTAIYDASLVEGCEEEEYPPLVPMHRITDEEIEQ